MEIFAINKHSIKFSLTREELTLRGLSAENLDRSGTSSKRLIWELMDRARIENGFDCGDARLLVRVFPSRDGGCELFVTLHGESVRSDAVQIASKGRGILCLPEEDEALFSLCRRMKAEGFHGKSKLYADEKNRLILLYGTERRLPSYIKAAEKRPSDFAFATEYGTVLEATDERQAYLAEHARLLCEKNAVETLSVIGSAQ